jgi:hypothetical protein
VNARTLGSAADADVVEEQAASSSRTLIRQLPAMAGDEPGFVITVFLRS